jgi:hypothetical protein
MNGKVRRPLGAFVLGTCSLAAPSGAAEKAPPPCAKAEHRQFDFWVGEWEVEDPKGNRVGENSITSVLGGCVIVENWRGRGGSNGTSLNTYDASRGVWHQTWVDDQGGLLQLDGKGSEGHMVLEGTKARGGSGTSRERITWEKKAADKVRQLWESSTDEGKTWKVLFDGLYVRAAAKEE